MPISDACRLFLCENFQGFGNVFFLSKQGRLMSN